MMYCTNCGASNKPESQYCEACGAKLPLAEPASPGNRSISQVPKQLKAMRIGDILDETIRLFRQNFRTLISIVAVVQVPLTILTLINFSVFGSAVSGMSSYTGRGAPIQTGSVIAYYVIGLVLGIVGGLGAIIMEAALTRVVAEGYLGNKITFGQSYKTALRYFWSLLGASVMVGLSIIFLFVTILGIPVAIYVAIGWSLVVQAIVLEGKGASAGMERSASLAKDNRWRMLGVFVLAWLAESILSSIPGAILGYGLAGLGVVLFPGSVILFTVISMAIGAVFNILAAPILPIVCILLYYDLRVRKEGFDLEVLSGQLAVAEKSTQGQL